MIGYLAEFMYQGLIDFSPYLSVTSCIQFIDQVCGGLQAMIKYNHELVIQAAQMLAEQWGTKLLCPPDMCGSMALIRLPLPKQMKVSKAKAVALTAYLAKQHKITVPIFMHRTGKGNRLRLYVRVSAQVTF